MLGCVQTSRTLLKKSKLRHRQFLGRYLLCTTLLTLQIDEITIEEVSHDVYLVVTKGPKPIHQVEDAGCLNVSGSMA